MNPSASWVSAAAPSWAARDSACSMMVPIPRGVRMPPGTRLRLRCCSSPGPAAGCCAGSSALLVLGSGGFVEEFLAIQQELQKMRRRSQDRHREGGDCDRHGGGGSRQGDDAGLLPFAVGLGRAASVRSVCSRSDGPAVFLQTRLHSQGPLLQRGVHEPRSGVGGVGTKLLVFRPMFFSLIPDGFRGIGERGFPRPFRSPGFEPSGSWRVLGVSSPRAVPELVQCLGHLCRNSRSSSD